MRYHTITQEDVQYFRTFIPKNNIYVKDERHNQYAHDGMELYGKFKPDLLIQVDSSEQVQKLVAYCNEKKIEFTPRGAGNGLCGGCVAIHGGLVLSFEEFNIILEIDKKTMIAFVEAGILLMEIADTVDEEKLLYAPDSGEKSASIGGNVGTNAGWMRAVKYGVTRDYVKGVEVVLANGQPLSFVE